jgi:hypothetical protein
MSKHFTPHYLQPRTKNCLACTYLIQLPRASHLTTLLLTRGPDGNGRLESVFTRML